MVKLNLPTAKVPQQFEYPMLYYPKSLEDILERVRDDRPILSSYSLEACPTVFYKHGFYLHVTRCRLYSVSLGIISLVIAVILSILAIDAWFLALFPALLGFIFTLVLSQYLELLTRQISIINRKLLARTYSLPQFERKSLAAKLLEQTVSQRQLVRSEYKYNRQQKKGILYEYFLHHLKNWFHPTWTIVNYRRIEKSYASTGEYILSLAYYNLAINVEIDEPYRLSNNQPTHYREDPFQLLRDRIFTDLGYVVIRFAEYQIVNHPNRCCLHIARTVNQFLSPQEKVRIPDNIEEDIQTPLVWQVQTWTKAQAKAMAKNQLRQKYLQKVVRLD